MIEVLKQAFEALKDVGVLTDREWQAVHKNKANELRQAIKELESQEPVAWRTFDGEGGYDYRSYEDNESYADDWNKRNPKHVGWVDELYTHSQRTWVGLTDEQIDACWNKDLWKEKQPHHIFAKAIESKLKQKNGFAEEKNT
jgi:surface antigen